MSARQLSSTNIDLFIANSLYSDQQHRPPVAEELIAIYTKFVEPEGPLFPDLLEEMVAVMARVPTIAFIAGSSYKID